MYWTLNSIYIQFEHQCSKSSNVSVEHVQLLSGDEVNTFLARITVPTCNSCVSTLVLYMGIYRGTVMC